MLTTTKKTRDLLNKWFGCLFGVYCVDSQVKSANFPRVERKAEWNEWEVGALINYWWAEYNVEAGRQENTRSEYYPGKNMQQWCIKEEIAIMIMYTSLVNGNYFAVVADVQTQTVVVRVFSMQLDLKVFHNHQRQNPLYYQKYRVVHISQQNTETTNVMMRRQKRRGDCVK